MEKNKKDLRKWIILIFVIIIAYWAINNLNTVKNLFNSILGILFPFVLGAGLAFVLNIPMSFFEKKLLKQKNKKLVRIVSIIFAIAVILLVLALIIRLIVPELIDIVNLLIENIPYYAEKITEIFKQSGANIGDINKVIQESNIDINEIKNKVINQIPTIDNTFVSSTVTPVILPPVASTVISSGASSAVA